MRLSSSRVAAAAALVAVLVVLVVAGRLLPTIPSADRSTTPSSVEVPAGTVRSIPPQDVPTSTIVGGVRVPNAIGHTLTRLELDQVYRRIIALCDAQKSITDDDLMAVIQDVKLTPAR